MKYNLMDIIIISALGTISGANKMVEICEFADANLDWLKSFFELKNGIPSHDTFERVFSKINPKIVAVLITTAILFNRLSPIKNVRRPKKNRSRVASLGDLLTPQFMTMS